MILFQQAYWHVCGACMLWSAGHTKAAGRACWSVSRSGLDHASMPPCVLRQYAYRPPHSRASMRIASCFGKWSMAATALAAVRSLGPAPAQQQVSPVADNRPSNYERQSMVLTNWLLAVTMVGAPAYACSVRVAVRCAAASVVERKGNSETQTS